ncbi:hypothetical protein [Amycolatopsis sp. NPDC059021]
MSLLGGGVVVFVVGEVFAEKAVEFFGVVFKAGGAVAGGDGQ